MTSSRTINCGVDEENMSVPVNPKSVDKLRKRILSHHKKEKALRKIQEALKVAFNYMDAGICPKCSSERIAWLFGREIALKMLIFVDAGTTYRCKDCGYTIERYGTELYGWEYREI